MRKLIRRLPMAGRMRAEGCGVRRQEIKRHYIWSLSVAARMRTV